MNYSDNNNSEKRVAIVTGGANGIGAAISKTLAKAGHHVMIAYRDTDNGQ
ncbi:MAG: NAD(P)-dependent dehydrogenase (short-subunit alcohol dehydrogenase family) [Cellvibrionaceae bacterium]|jgi:NAD(P)-dependent dehydrogenase (short-subunit alcohol dehydrogenase family)